MKLSSHTDALFIHLFALAHALTAIITRLVNYVDDVPLTILTISLIVIISIRKKLQPEVMAALTLVGCFVGYVVGIWGARLLGELISNEMFAAAITTAAVTELIGWSVHGFTSIKGGETAATENRNGWTPSLIQVLVFAAAILFLRIGYMLIFQSPDFAPEGTHSEFRQLMGNTLSTMSLICGNVIFVSLLARSTHSIPWRNVLMVITTLIFSLIITLFTYYDLPKVNNVEFDAQSFLRMYAVVLLTDIILFTIFRLISYVIESKEIINKEIDKKHLAQFQYNKLKLQINPHFLFNSLNILDYLVQEKETERASSFIHKLAAIYRYMLKNEDKQLVRLEEEIAFADKYIDLLQERFTSGFSVSMEIPDEYQTRSVVPCCLQLLIENATKHNIVSTESPLHIHISIEDEMLVVSNNLQPRLNVNNSTGIGLKNISQQYLDLAHKDITIKRTDTAFTVKLPLL